ncbi:MAG TPA: ankyrin repeat domain-containing protein, partial [Bryobacteraceae bacterium]|nr:ankyrin repeat domain-containing protein [Bryobacteraceae bacterium]
MPNSKLPERPSLEYLKKLAKDRLQDLRRADAKAKLASALLAVARDHGFASWRALKSEIEQRQTQNAAIFFEACTRGNVETLRALLASDPSLARLEKADRFGGTGLHAAAGRGHVEAVHLLLAHGADPNAREAGDNTYALHWAVANGHIETVRALLDAGGDVHGLGDVHELDVIGWATFFRPPDENPRDVVSLLLERGALHHIFSAICIGDLKLIQQLVEENPEALDRRLSRFEQGQTPLHLALNQNRYDILDLLIELGADVEAEDKNGQTVMAVATLRGDRAAMTRLEAAGAEQPKRIEISNLRERMAQLAGSIKKIVPMIRVPDIAKTLEWYASIGFKEIARYEAGGVVNFGMLSFGNAEVMQNM